MKIPFNLLVLKVFNAQKNRIRPLILEIGLSPGQPKILHFLALHDNCRQKELADACDIDPATISKLLNNMEENRLIVRNDVDGDKRAAGIGITARGRRIYRELAARFEAVNAISLQNFSAEEQRQFEIYLCRMYENLTGNRMKF